MMLSQSPSATYRRIDLDARIEASAGNDLTRICLEEVVQALGQALAALERGPQAKPAVPLARAHSIALWLGRTVAANNPLKAELTRFYGGLASLIARNIGDARKGEIAQARTDFADVLAALGVPG